MSPTELAAIAARAEAASPGPWVCHLGQPDDMPANTCRCANILAMPYEGAVGQVFVDNGKRIADGGNDCPPEPEARANAAFIAHAREDVPSLLKEVERLRGLIKQAEWTTRNAAENTVCAFGCATGDDRWRDQSRHSATCPVFTPDGVVR